MRLRRGRDTPTVAGQVVVDSAEFVLGDEVTGRVTLRNLPPETHGTVKLGQLRMFETQASGGEAFEGWANEASDFFSVATAPLSSDASGSVEASFALAIPPNAPPSVPTDIEWRVVADLDTPGAYVESPMINVLAPRDAFLEVLDRTAELSPHDWSISPEVDVDVGDGCVRCGDTLLGRLVVTPDKDIKARELSVSLHGHFDPLGRDERIARFDQSLELGRDVDLAAGRRHEFPFSIKIPDDAIPTIWEDPQTRRPWLDRKYDDHQLYPTMFWHLRGLVAKGRVFGWKQASVAIHVYNAP